MLLWGRIRAVLLLWGLAELLVFVLLVHFFGFGPILLAVLASSILGLLLLKRVGVSAQLKLRAVFQGRAERAGAADGALQTLGAVALVLPGFVSDVVGLALLLPPVRARAIARFGGVVSWQSGGVRTRPSTVDLTPDEWQRSEGRSPPEIGR